MRRLGRALGWAFAVGAVVAGAWGLVVARSINGDADFGRAVESLRWLSGDLDAKSDVMQRHFPEGRVFTAALVGIAWAEVGGRDSTLAPEALANAQAALEIAIDSVSKRSFGPAGELPLGMFYEAWTGRLRVGVGRLAAARGNAFDRAALVASCRRLDAAFREGGYRDSYPAMAWPADNVVGVAALAGCGDLVDPGFRVTAEAWARTTLDGGDGSGGWIPHAADRPGVRGSSSALMIPFLAEVDPSLARVAYRRFASAFPVRLAGVLPAVREYPRGISGRGDVDSGPLVFGVSAPATVVGVAAARTVGDTETSRALQASIEAVGVPLAVGGERQYALGLLPVGDAFLAWARTVPVRGRTALAPYDGWRGRWLTVAVLMVLAGGGVGVGLWRTRSP